MFKVFVCDMQRCEIDLPKLESIVLGNEAFELSLHTVFESMILMY